MPLFMLRLIGIAIVAVIVGVSCTSPATAPAPGGYEAAVKVLSGGAAITGSLCLAGAIGRTFLRSGGVVAFRAAYVAALALSGPGLVEVLSAFRPVNVVMSLLAYSMVAIVTGVLWAGFYGHAD